YKGADSVELLRHCVSLLGEYKVSNIDATVIAQKPKLAPHIDGMRKNLADAIGIDISRVSIKATTEEKLGFTGRLEGISAHCVALIILNS
ncbi:MAG: 2-C-methyl-D-erythritol 2,4-cyclodiphosphate synthase, partial [Clostridia bacterium]|nr:2-C-methyl-D-erythritol 2,4-cyclodiphosphate synthase [Clostridia bacterium]